MPTAFSSAVRRLDDYASASWPRLWRLRPHLLLMVLCLTVAASFAVKPLLPSDAKDVATQHWLLAGLAFTALTAALLYWSREVGRALHVRAFPGLRYSPHIIVVCTVAALNVGAFALVTAPLLGALRVPSHWGETSVYLYAFGLVAGVVSIALLLRWFSIKALLWFIVAVLISQSLQGAFGQQLGLQVVLLLAILILLAFVVTAWAMLAQGARRHWTPVAAVIAFTLGLHGEASSVLQELQIPDFGLGSVELSQGDHRSIYDAIRYVACFALLLWLVARLDLLPEIDPARHEGSAAAPVWARSAQTSLSARLRRAADHASRRWPSLWRLRLDLLLLIACLSLALGHILVWLPTLYTPHPGGIPSLEVVFVGSLFLLGVSLLYWLYAVGFAPRIRAFPELRYRPRFAFVASATALLLALVMIFPGSDRIIFSGAEPISIRHPRLYPVIYGYIYAMLLLVMTSKWFSLRRALFALIVLLALTACFVIFPTIGLLLLGLGAVLVLAAFMIVVRIRGARNRWVPGAMVLAVFLVHFTGLILAALAEVIADRLPYKSVLPSFYPLAFCASVLLAQLVCWASAKLELLPERR